MTPKVLAFAGSSRQDSVNKKLLAVAVSLAREMGAQVTQIDLADFEMPLYHADLENAQGLPDNVKRLKALMRGHERFLIASPEYNSSITPLLKNTIDWCSRSETEDEPTLQCFQGKIAGLISASPGALGGLRALRHLREILGNIGVLVVPAQYSLSNAYEAFDSSGALTNESARPATTKVVRQLLSAHL